MAPRILLTAGRLPFALELVRSLSAAGAKVFVADVYPLYVCQASKGVTRSFRVPSPQKDFAAFRQAILTIVTREKIDTIIPVSEEVLYLALFRDELAQRAKVFFPPLSLLTTLHHKERFVSYCEALGLSVPRTVSYRGQSELPAFAGRPYIIKRNYSRSGGAVHFPEPGRHPSAFGLPVDGSWLMQEKAAGEALCSVSVLRGGRVELTRLYRPATALGTVSVMFCRADHEAVRSWIERFAAFSGYEGIVSFDFFVKDQEVFAIECNPRPTSGLHLCEPTLLSAALLGQAPPRREPPPRERALIALGLLTALPRLIREKKLKALLPDLLRARDVITSWRDPAPFFYQILCYLYIFWRMFRTRQSLVVCMMEGVEWNDDQERGLLGSEPTAPASSAWGASA